MLVCSHRGIWQSRYCYSVSHVPGNPRLLRQAGFLTAVTCFSACFANLTYPVRSPSEHNGVHDGTCPLSARPPPPPLHLTVLPGPTRAASTPSPTPTHLQNPPLLRPLPPTPLLPRPRPPHQTRTRRPRHRVRDHLPSQPLPPRHGRCARRSHRPTLLYHPAPKRHARIPDRPENPPRPSADNFPNAIFARITQNARE